MHRPFFSIIIPTYNRSNYLRLALTHILNQTFQDFEIIISDNCSTDDTKNVIYDFNTRKVKYYRNKENTEIIPNIIKALKRATGGYFLLHGDDDYLLSEDSLKDLHKIIKKFPLGYFRLNYLSLKDNKLFDYKMSKEFKKDEMLKPKSNNDEVFEFIEKSDPYFMSGICLKKFNIKKSDFTESELAPWFPIVFSNTKKFGSYYCSDYFLAANWVTKSDHPLYRLINGKFTFEIHLKKVSKIISKKNYINLRIKLVKSVIFFFPLIKANKGIKTLFVCAQRVTFLYPQIKFSIFFWVSLLSSIILPSLVIRNMREYYLSSTIKKNTYVKESN